MMIRIFLFFVFIIFYSCSLENNTNSNCIYYEGTSTTAVEGPSETTRNVPIDLTVTFNVYNSCGQFYLFHEEPITNGKIITVNAVYEGCDCTQALYQRTKNYTFSSSTTGSFLLRFKLTNATYIDKTITVNE